MGEFGAHATVQVSLAPGVVGKDVEDAERRGVELDGEPGAGVGLLLDDRLRIREKCATSASLPGFACTRTISPTRITTPPSVASSAVSRPFRVRRLRVCRLDGTRVNTQLLPRPARDKRGRGYLSLLHSAVRGVAHRVSDVQ